jgi:hypothetical protein
MLLHEAERGHGGNRLADGGGLEESAGIDGTVSFDVGDTICLGPMNLEIADDGDAEARNITVCSASRW